MKQQLTDARKNEEGLITPLIPMLMMMSTFPLVPGIGMANTALRGKGAQTGILAKHYARDAIKLLSESGPEIRNSAAYFDEMFGDTGACLC